MNRCWGNAIGIAGLILMLGGTPSWGAPPNNDVSDAAGNTASGQGALVHTTTGGVNTASGAVRLRATPPATTTRPSG